MTTPRPSLAASPDGNYEPTIFSPYAMFSLRRTKGWVLFQAIVEYIFAGLSIVTAIMVVCFAFAIPSRARSAGSELEIVAILHLLAAVLFMVNGICMHRYAIAIGRLLRSGASMDVEAAMEAQRRVWKLYGILTIIGLLLFVVGTLVGISGAVRF